MVEHLQMEKISACGKQEGGWRCIELHTVQPAEAHIPKPILMENLRELGELV